MNQLKTAAGALAIMVAAGMIADFDLAERNNDIYVTVWSLDDQSESRLRRHVAALLPHAIDESRVFVVRDLG